MDLLNLLIKRRSIRKYTDAKLPKQYLEMILNAGLLSPSGRNRQPWEFIVVEEKEVLAKLSKARAHGAGMLENAAAAIVVFADPDKTDVWTEDCCIAMSNMHLMATELGVGSCWIQGRLREAADGRTTENYIQDLLAVPENYKLEAILSLGMQAEFPMQKNMENLPKEKIHRGKF